MLILTLTIILVAVAAGRGWRELRQGPRRASCHSCHGMNKFCETNIHIDDIIDHYYNNYYYCTITIIIIILLLLFYRQGHGGLHAIVAMA